MNDSPPELKPGFSRALHGAWLFTWKTRLTWTKLSVLGPILLILPALIYITTPNRARWTRHQIGMGPPLLDFSNVNTALRVQGQPLRPEQAEQLRQIMAQEYARTEEILGEVGSGAAAVEKRKAAIQACFDRIRARAPSSLGEAQLRPLRRIETQKLATRERQGVAWNRTTPFPHWLIDLFFLVILPVSCVASCGALIREEVQANTLGFFTTRPLVRAGLVLVKYLCQTAWLQMVLLVQALLLFAAGWSRQVPNLGSLLPLFLATQFLAVLVWSALGAFLGLVSKRYMALALLYGFVVELGIGRIPTNINSLSMTRHLKSLLSRNATLEEVFDWPSRGIPFSVGALLLATAFFVALACALFTFREYHHTTEMQK